MNRGEPIVETRRALLAQVDEAVESIILAVLGVSHPESLQVDDWSAKDTLGHIAYWHESFARNVKAIATGREPAVLAGDYPLLNQMGVARSRSMSVGQIAGRIRRAQGVIRHHIPSLPAGMQIPYRKGSRNYTPDEHLKIVRDHIMAHAKRIEKAKRPRR